MPIKLFQLSESCYDLLGSPAEKLSSASVICGKIKPCYHAVSMIEYGLCCVILTDLKIAVSISPVKKFSGTSILIKGIYSLHKPCSSEDSSPESFCSLLNKPVLGILLWIKVPAMHIAQL